MSESNEPQENDNNQNGTPPQDSNDSNNGNDTSEGTKAHNDSGGGNNVNWLTVLISAFAAGVVALAVTSLTLTLTGVENNQTSKVEKSSEKNWSKCEEGKSDKNYKDKGYKDKGYNDKGYKDYDDNPMGNLNRERLLQEILPNVQEYFEGFSDEMEPRGPSQRNTPGGPQRNENPNGNMENPFPEDLGDPNSPQSQQNERFEELLESFSENFQRMGP